MQQTNLRPAAWGTAEYDALLRDLHGCADEGYRAFHSGLLPGVDNLLGVRMPQLHRIAREIARGDWRGFLETAGTQWYEEDMLCGLTLAYAANRAEPDEIQARLIGFLPRIDNWAVCDCVCSAFKAVRRHPDEYLAFCRQCLASDDAFTVRFGVVMLLFHYTRAPYLETVLLLLPTIKHPDYYVRMAVAWCLQVCFAADRAAALPLLEPGVFDDFTRRKALAKLMDSRRVTPEDKALLRALRNRR